MAKKVLPLVGLVVVMLAMAPVVSAQEPQDKGSLTAQGDGIAVLWGKGVVDLNGNGILWIKDGAGDAVIRVTGQGEKKEFPDGWLQYAGFHGTAHVEGSRVTVGVAGVEIDLNAHGRGRVWLWGHGSYQSPGQSGEWRTGLGTRIRLMMP